MSTDLARDLIARYTTDAEFRERVERAPFEEKRAILEAEGFGEVRLRHLAEMLPESAGGELSDEEFAAVAGGDGTLTVATAAVTGGVTGATVGAAALAGLGVL